jgi:hypothetical protein
LPDAKLPEAVFPVVQEANSGLPVVEVEQAIPVGHVRAVTWFLPGGLRATKIMDFQDVSREALAVYYSKNLPAVKEGQKIDRERENGI